MIFRMMLFVLTLLIVILQSNCHVFKQNVSKSEYNGTVHERFYGTNQKCVLFEKVFNF